MSENNKKIITKRGEGGLLCFISITLSHLFHTADDGTVVGHEEKQVLFFSRPFSSQNVLVLELTDDKSGRLNVL